MDEWMISNKKTKVGKLIIILVVVGVCEAADSQPGRASSTSDPNRNVSYNRGVNCGSNPYSRTPCRTNSRSFVPEFDCSDPQGLPCDEAYGLKDVLDGLKLPSGDRPEFTRLNCTQSTDSITITCVCSALNNIQVCHITYITTRAVDLSGGIIHENVSLLSQLQHLDLAVNHLHCKIPDSLGQLKALKELYLYNNFLQGPIPPSFGNLASLETLDLSRNMLSGEIPRGLGKLSHLVRINLKENQLTGNLPREFGNLINLKSFAVASNYLDGILDYNYHKLTSLVTFDVGGNNLSGPIPGFISKWENLTTLDLLGNNFKGNVPPDIFKMPQLEYLRISDLRNNEGFAFPKQANLTNIQTLVLRNCKIYGHIPQVIGNWPKLYLLDLSFNSLFGPIPYALENVSVILLTGNMLAGIIPPWLNAKGDLTDVSYNNNSLIPHFNSRNRKSNNTTTPTLNILPTRNYTDDPKNRHCDSLSRSLFINCGGGKQTYERDEYEEDTSLEKFYESKTKRWAYSCSGNFLSDNTNASNYIKNKTCGVSDQGLQETARLCPVKLTYYGFCLHNGNYSVKLQFAELLFATEDDYSSRGKRIFDVYIQGEKRLQDFNIKNETGGEANKATTTEFIANVQDNQLVIHFYWAGKGSLSNSPILNGPLVSAISVSPNFTISGEKNLSAGQITGITVGSVLAPLLLLAFLWKMGWLGTNELKKVQVKVEENSFTLQQIIDATRNFSPSTEIGRGRFGIVYKAEFPNDKIVLAVKKISPDLMQDKLKTELHGEIYSLQSLKHDNLIKLYDGYSKKDLHLLIYEYMEKGSLHQAVLDPNPKDVLDWKVRFDICLGLAKALKYLHEDSGLMFLHRNIKASNILLDGTYTAKLTDFGWARLYNEEDPFLTIKAGAARVYIAPEYALGQPITVKADVYSYGVVMLEVFSGRPSIQYKPNQEAAYLLDDARMAHAQKRMDKLVDTKMVNYDRKVVYTALNLAHMCINPTANLRPTMSEVVSVLLGEKSLEEITKAHISEAK